MPTELQSASIRIKLEPQEAEQELDRLEREVAERKKRIEGTDKNGVDEQRTPNDDARAETGEKGNRRRSYDPADDGASRSRAAEAARTVGRGIEKGWNLARARWETPPSVQVENLAASIADVIPVIGAAAVATARTGAFVGKYGPGVIGGIRGAVPKEYRDEVEKVLAVPQVVIDAQRKYAAAATALDRTTEESKDLFVAAAKWGTGLSASDIKTEFSRLYSVNYARDQNRRLIDQIGNEMVGEVVGERLARYFADTFLRGGAR